MSRYINVDSLIPETVDEVEYGGDDGRRLYSRKIIVYSKKQIDEAPTADVVEVMHGEWIKMDKRGKNVQCSKCGNTLDLRGVNAGRGDANYCPNCGAKMEG